MSPTINGIENDMISRVARIQEGVEIVAALRGKVDEDLVVRVESLFKTYMQIEEQIDGDLSLPIALTRIAVLVDRLEPLLSKSIESERLRAEASKIRADTIAKIATPRNFFVAVVIFGILVGGAFGLPVRDIIAIFGGGG